MTGYCEDCGNTLCQCGPMSLDNVVQMTPSQVPADTDYLPCPKHIKNGFSGAVFNNQQFPIWDEFYAHVQSYMGVNATRYRCFVNSAHMRPLGGQ